MAKSVLSHIVRKSQVQNRPFVIRHDHLPAYRNAGPLPTPSEQADNFILWLGDQQKSPELYVSNSTKVLAAIVGSRISENDAAFTWLLGEIGHQQLFTRHPEDVGGQPGFRLTINGWNRYHELKHKNVVSRRAFMAMQFNDDKLQDILGSCFKPAVAAAGFELRPLNEGQPAGLIDNQIRAAIRSARFVIADLSHDNNGAYFEAGFAEGLGLPVIYTCEAKKFKEKKTHFDTNHMVTIPWDELKLGEAESQLTATIRNTFPADADQGS
jgi:hypothetical protein